MNKQVLKQVRVNPGLKTNTNTFQIYEHGLDITRLVHARHGNHKTETAGFKKDKQTTSLKLKTCRQSGNTPMTGQGQMED